MRHFSNLRGDRHGRKHDYLILRGALPCLSLDYCHAAFELSHGIIPVLPRGNQSGRQRLCYYYDCIRRAKFIEEDTKRSSHKALRLILFSAVFSVAGMQVGSYIGAVGILWYLETMAEDVSAGSYMSFFPQVLQSRPTRHWCVCYLLSGRLGVAMYMVIAGGYMILLRSLLFA